MCLQWNITINYSRVGFKLGIGSMAYNVDKRNLDDKLKHTLEVSKLKLQKPFFFAQFQLSLTN